MNDDEEITFTCTRLELVAASWGLLIAAAFLASAPRSRGQQRDKPMEDAMRRVERRINRAIVKDMKQRNRKTTK